MFQTTDELADALQRPGAKVARVFRSYEAARDAWNAPYTEALIKAGVDRRYLHNLTWRLRNGAAVYHLWPVACQDFSRWEPLKFDAISTVTWPWYPPLSTAAVAFLMGRLRARPPQGVSTAWRDAQAAWMRSERERTLRRAVEPVVPDTRTGPGTLAPSGASTLGNEDVRCARCGEPLSKHAKVAPYGSHWVDTPRGVERDWEFRLVCPDGLFQSKQDAARDAAFKGMRYSG